MSNPLNRISPMKFFALLATFLTLASALLAATGSQEDPIILPSGQVNVTYAGYTVTTVEEPAPGRTYSASGLPSGLSINTSTGAISGTPLSAGVFDVSLSITEEFVNTFYARITIAPALGAPQITSDLTALGAVGEPFTAQLSADNSPTSFNIGALPPGLAYDSGLAQITGTPTNAGTYNVTISANNSSGTGDAVTLVITIDPSGPVPVISGDTSITNALNVALNYQITASNSPTAYAASGLPVGITLNTSTGLITGTPTVGGISQATLTASNGNGSSANFTLTFILGPVAVINSASTITGYAGVAIDLYQLSATNSPTSFNVGSLPAGLSYSSGTQRITGTPSAAGNTNVTLSANNSVGTGPAFTLAIQIAAPVAPSISAHPQSQTVDAGQGVTFTVTASGSPSPTYQWQKDEVDIPSATSASYTIASTEAGSAGTYRVVVTNVAGTLASDPATLTVNVTAFATWRTDNFPAEDAANDLISGLTADPDRDGLNNLMEYALGLDPLAVNTGATTVSRTSTDWVFTYQRPDDRPDLQYSVQYSTNLTTWTTAANHVRTATGTTETWQSTVPISTGANLFFRVRVVRSTPD